MPTDKELLQEMSEETRKAVETYGAALDTSSEHFVSLLKTCSLEEKRAISQWLDVLNKYKGLGEKGALIDSIINVLICKGIGEDEFYQLLFESLNEICAHMDEERSEFSLLVMCNAKMPYAGSWLVCLTDDKYIDLTHLLRDQFNELIRIYDANYPQKTQTSSSVLRVFDTVEDGEQRAVLLSLWNNLVASGGTARQLAE